MKALRIAVVHDAIGPDAPVDQADALVQAAAVAEALVALGHVPVVVPFALDPAPLRALDVALVFNLVESVGGDGRGIVLAPALFETMGMPYTGAASCAMAISSHKRLCKRVLYDQGLAVPEDYPDGDAPFIVKSLWEDASLGLADDCIIEDPSEVPAAIDRLRGRLGGEIVAERFIAGREINVSVLQTEDGLRVLPIAEIAFDLPAGRRHLVGYAAKWDPDSVEWAGTPRTFDVPGLDHEMLSELARRAFVAVGLRGYGRVDFRVGADGVPVVLEVNANPCLSPDAGFIAAAQRAGLDLTSVVAQLVRGGLGGSVS